MIMSTETVAIAADDALLNTDFAREMVKQLRALDTYDIYEKWTHAQILAPLILSKERKAEIPIIGDPDEETIARVKAYYNALSSLIEAQSAIMAVPFINLSHEGFGRALIMSGKLVVVDKTLRDVHRFGFKSLEKMCEEAHKTITKAVALIEQYPEVAHL
jgi:probable nitrogen fixation protein